MGSPQSKVEAPKNVESQTNMIEESSGSYFLEIHAPTAGIGFFTIFAILLAFICLFGLYRKCERHTQRRPQQLGTFPGMSFQHSDPMQAYCQFLLLQQLRDQRDLPRHFYPDAPRFTLLDQEPHSPTVTAPLPSEPVSVHSTLGQTATPIKSPSMPTFSLPVLSPRLSDPPLSLS